MKKIGKLKLKNNFELLEDNEMKTIIGSQSSGACAKNNGTCSGTCSSIIKTVWENGQLQTKVVPRACKAANSGEISVYVPLIIICDCVEVPTYNGSSLVY